MDPGVTQARLEENWAYLQEDRKEFKEKNFKCKREREPLKTRDLTSS